MSPVHPYCTVHDQPLDWCKDPDQCREDEEDPDQCREDEEHAHDTAVWAKQWNPALYQTLIEDKEEEDS